MGCDIHWHSETRTDTGWTCDQAATFVNDTGDYYGEGENEAGKTHYDMDDLKGRDRNYWFFGLLANGVRRNWPFSFEEKGQPGDMSHEVGTIVQQWEGDGHSHSWLTREELICKKAELEKLRPELLINPHEDYQAQHLDELISCLATTIANMEEASPGTAPEDQRLVFFFDN